MKHIFKLIFLLSLSALFYSCEDHVGIPSENGQRVRLKRLYTSIVPVPSRSYDRYADFFYDQLGRLNSVPYFVIDSSGTPVLKQHTIIYYNQKGKVERERTDGDEARTVLYGYDSLDRVKNIWIKVDAAQGTSGIRLFYGQAGEVSSRVYYDLNDAGDSTTISREEYVYDGNKNIVGLRQTWNSNISPPFVRTATYKYDDKPNPWYNLPIFIYRFGAQQNGRNNIIEATSTETYPAPTNSSYTATHQFNNKYSNGLLEEIENGPDNVWKFVYESY